MTFGETFLVILCILGIMYTGLYLYFEIRKEEREKEWLKRNQQQNYEKK